jgi:hypothetical protein
MKRILKFLFSFIKYLFLGSLVSNEELETRLSFCNTCEYLKNDACSICTCKVKLKTKWTTEKCPINKW